MPELIVIAIGVYALIGIIFGIYFVLVGVNKVDPAAKISGFSFRLFILPGSVGLWPIMLVKLITAKPMPEAHQAAVEMPSEEGAQV